MDDKLDEILKQEMNNAIGMDGTPLFDTNAPEAAPVVERTDEEQYLEHMAKLRTKTSRELIGLRTYWKVVVDDCESQLKAIQVANTPDKWPGGNETERATAREKAFATNADLIVARVRVSLAAGNLTGVAAELEIRAEERKQAEFKLREREAELKDRELILKQHDQALRETELTMAIKATLPFSLTGTSAIKI